MPRSDQVHALKVWAAVKLAGFDDPALAQAALLHDVAKHLGGVTLLHRVAVVLIKAFAPGAWRAPEDVSRALAAQLRYPLWAHANHPATSAQLADGCRMPAAGRQPDPPAPGNPAARRTSASLAKTTLPARAAARGRRQLRPNQKEYLMPEKLQVAIVGLGLIGASAGLALHRTRKR